MRNVVVLPAPLGPSRPVISPSRAVNDTPSTAFTSPKDLCRFLTSIIAGTPHPFALRYRRANIDLKKAVRASIPQHERLPSQPASRRRSVERDERRHRADAFQTSRIELFRFQVGDEVV